MELRKLETGEVIIGYQTPYGIVCVIYFNSVETAKECLSEWFNKLDKNLFEKEFKDYY